MEKFENEFASIFYDETLDAITLVFKKQTPLNDFIAVNQKLLDEFIKLSANKFIVDARQMGVVAIEGQQWVVNNLFPGMLAHLKGENLYHVQVLPTTDIFAKVAGSNIKNKAKKENDTNLVFESFFSEEEAKDWLNQY